MKWVLSALGFLGAIAVLFFSGFKSGSNKEKLTAAKDNLSKIEKEVANAKKANTIYNNINNDSSDAVYQQLRDQNKNDK